MRIISGQLPERSLWQALILISPATGFHVGWQLACAMTLAHSGKLLAVIIVDTAEETAVSAAEAILAQARHEAAEQNVPLETLIVETQAVKTAVRSLIRQLAIDVLFVDAADPDPLDINRLPCTVAAVRSQLTVSESGSGHSVKSRPELRRVLLPTSGGPNTTEALQWLLSLTPDVETTALHIVSRHLGRRAELRGRKRVRQLLNYADANGRIETHFVHADNVADGIVNEANDGYDLVIVGGSQESRLEKILFGDIVHAVAEQSQTPIVVVRGPGQPLNQLVRHLGWRLQSVLPRMGIPQRANTYVRIRRNARPTVDFYILIAVSAMIASLGLILNSAAVAIGAMLVAPLMSPIMGTGLAAVLGDVRFLHLSLKTVARGALLAVLVGLISGLFYPGRLLTPEMVARTAPTLLDLGVALFAGAVGAYALCRSEAASALPGVAIAAALVPPLATVGIAFSTGNIAAGFGALLLFLANFAAISASSAVVFLILGFHPTPAKVARRSVQIRTMRLVLAILATISILLRLTTLNGPSPDTGANVQVEEIIRANLAELGGTELAAHDVITLDDNRIRLDIVALSANAVSGQALDQLQNQISQDLEHIGLDTPGVEMNLTVIDLTELDPTRTVTATPWPTDTPTPSPTPTETPTPTPVPRQAMVDNRYGLNLRAAAGVNATLLAYLPAGTMVTLLPGEAMADGILWRRVMLEGEVGWVVGMHLRPFDPANR